jgi:hypothetical protein
LGAHPHRCQMRQLLAIDQPVRLRIAAAHRGRKKGLDPRGISTSRSGALLGAVDIGIVDVAGRNEARQRRLEPIEIFFAV